MLGRGGGVDVGVWRGWEIHTYGVRISIGHEADTFRKKKLQPDNPFLSYECLTGLHFS